MISSELAAAASRSATLPYFFMSRAMLKQTSSNLHQLCYSMQPASHHRFQDICDIEAAFELGSMRGQGLHNRCCCFEHTVLGEMVVITVTCDDNIQLVYKILSEHAAPSTACSSPALERSSSSNWSCSTSASPVKQPACVSAVRCIAYRASCCFCAEAFGCIVMICVFTMRCCADDVWCR